MLLQACLHPALPKLSVVSGTGFWSVHKQLSPLVPRGVGAKNKFSLYFIVILFYFFFGGGGGGGEDFYVHGFSQNL